MTNNGVLTSSRPGERFARRVLDRLEGFSRPTPGYPPSYRTNDRWVRDDPELAAELFACLKLPELQQDDEGRVWRLAGLNPRMRACRYRAGQWFGIHRDGVHWASAQERSFSSVLVYLDAGFDGGRTRFFGDRAGHALTGQLAPERGGSAVFDHRRWHDGAPVARGVKHVLRTDVMYRREGAPERGHLGYVWSLAALGDRLASGGRDKTIRIWARGRAPVATRAHEASVSCLLALSERVLVSGSRDRRVRRWRVEDDGRLSPIGELAAHEGTVLALLDWDGRVVSAGADGVVQTEGGAREARHRGWVWGLARSARGELVSVGEDGRLVIGARVIELGVALTSVAAIGDRLVVGARDGTLRWLTEEGRLLWRADAHEGAVSCVRALDAETFASGGEDGRVRRWRGVEEVGARAHRDFVRDVCAHPELGLVSAGYDGLRARV